MKEKFLGSDRKTKIKLLSVLPKDWSISKIHNAFDGHATRYMITHMKKLVETQGILCDTTEKIGSKTLSENTVQKVVEFYRSDDITRACPGMHDCICYRENGEKFKIQKRLILMNLKEAFAIFKTDFSTYKMGFSKFASLRPPECILTTAACGIHVTCVCVYHQNVKLIADYLKKKSLIGHEDSYRDIINIMLCPNASDKCRLNDCQECPGTDELRSSLYIACEEQMTEDFNFKQWINSGNGTRLETVERSVDDFIEVFCDQMEVLNKHDFITKKQSDYLKFQKENLNENELIVLMDFSENLSFEIQDAAQSFYYGKPQTTIHPICIYFKSNNELKHKSLIVIAESLKHNVESVYQFQCKLVEYIKIHYGNKKIIFFSDGAASQYKNKKNFLNLCMFETDFGIKAEWHFFATSHDKSPCDALGGAFKRNVRNYNMKHPTDGIDSPRKLFEWTQKIEDGKIDFIFCTNEEYEEVEKSLTENRFQRKIKTIAGTRSFHSFEPITDTTIKCKHFSVSEISETFEL